MTMQTSTDPGGFVPRLVAAGASVTLDRDGDFVLVGGGAARPDLARELLAFSADLRAVLEDPVGIF